ncbi:hypothetical protein V6N12_004277 [Hibiscus sabdariffa]|uniref:Uncharacterized protein n=1 Tax=Hibiscus sabdariffa TaxID=183260 RepID=A0ABR2CL11_9ROSI
MVISTRLQSRKGWFSLAPIADVSVCGGSLTAPSGVVSRQVLVKSGLFWLMVTSFSPHIETARSGYGTTRFQIISGLKRSQHSLREARFFCSQRQAANSIKTVFRAWLITMPKGCCTQGRPWARAKRAWLYTGSYDRTVKAWRLQDNKCVDTFVVHESKVNAIVVNQDDGCVFTCSSDGSVKIWRRLYRENSHTLTMTLRFQQSPVNAMAISSTSNNCFLYSGSSDGTINFWEKERMSGRFNHGGFLQGHRFSVLCLVAIEKLIFSGSEDTTIRVWRREEGSCFHECLAVLDGHRGPVRCLAACLQMEKIVMGFLVYSASLDQTFKVWRVKVMPEEKTCFDIEDRNNSKTRTTAEYEMSPVLSPSWVEKKIKGNHFQ